MNTPNQFSYRIARRAGQQGARPSSRHQVEVEKSVTGTNTNKTHNSQLVANRKIKMIASFNVRTLSHEKNLHELIGHASQYDINVICIQEHRIYHPDSETKFFGMLAKGWVLVTSSAKKNNKNVSIGGVGLSLSPKAYKALTKVEKIGPRILQATFDGNPKTAGTSCYSPTNTCESKLDMIFIAYFRNQYDPYRNITYKSLEAT